MKNIKYLITTGDPNGIGPEIILKAASQNKLTDCVVIGSNSVYKYYSDKLKINIKWEDWNIYNDYQKNIKFYLIDIDKENKTLIEPGQSTSSSGFFSLKCIDTAISFLKTKNFKHIITGPISKKAVSYHINDFIGHTEYFAKEFNVNNFSMMLANEIFKVILVTTHLPLKEVALSITKEKIKTAIYNGDKFLKSINDKRGIAVCALNPHAGEDGLLGNEEIDIIIPAIEEAANESINVKGPFPADTLFKSVFTNEYGIYIAMYHDQGLGPLKMLTKTEGVNITLGLPIFRISVDHGTAYNISGKGIASPDSLITAINIAKSVNF